MNIFRTNKRRVKIPFFVLAALLLAGCGALASPTAQVDERSEAQIYFDNASQGAETLYLEDFSDSPEDWPEGSTDFGGRSYFEDGIYRLESVEFNDIIFKQLDGNYEDVLVTVTIRGLETEGSGGVGIYCRYQDFENFYILGVTYGGYFSIFRSLDAEYTELVEWTLSDQVDWQKNDMQLTALCSKDRLILALDAKVLAEIRDKTFASGDVGFSFNASAENIGMSTAIDDFTLFAPAK